MTLERITIGVWGDRRRGTLHVDVEELRRGEWIWRTRQQTAVRAIAQLRWAGIEGVIVAHLRGIGRRGLL